MNQYDGTVFYLDLLGIGALTRNTVHLDDKDYAAHGVKFDRNPQIFCAHLLSSFRQILIKVGDENKKIKIAQLSDSAFIWSDDTRAVLLAAISIMNLAVKAGLLCRGGIAYGQIVEPNKTKHSLGQFIVGEAVTSAVGLESTGRGCRVFSDVSLPRSLKPNDYYFSELFECITSPLKGDYVDEFMWYAYDETRDVLLGRRPHYPESRAIVSYKMTELLLQLKYSEKFSWNSSSDQGVLQLAISIERVSFGISRLLHNHPGFYIKLEDALEFLASSSRKNEVIAKFLKVAKKNIEDALEVYERNRESPTDSEDD